MPIPTTCEEAAGRLAGLWRATPSNAWDAVGEQVMNWIRDAKWEAMPRLRPAAEKPALGDTIVVAYQNGITKVIVWRPGMRLVDVFGWYLLHRQVCQLTLPDQARLLGPPPAEGVGSCRPGSTPWKLSDRRWPSSSP